MRRDVRLLTLVSVAAGLTLFVLFGPTAVRQQRWMAMARRHVPAVEALLRSDPAFADVTVGVGTGGGGTLLVVGHVAEPRDLERLRTIVAGTAPPVETVYVVRVQ